MGVKIQLKLAYRKATKSGRYGLFLINHTWWGTKEDVREVPSLSRLPRKRRGALSPGGLHGVGPPLRRRRGGCQVLLHPRQEHLWKISLEEIYGRYLRKRPLEEIFGADLRLQSKMFPLTIQWRLSGWRSGAKSLIRSSGEFHPASG